MKKLLIAGLLVAGAAVMAAECDYCTVNLRDKWVYRCMKCKQRFCSSCDAGAAFQFPHTVKCPNCGNSSQEKHIGFGIMEPDSRKIKVLRRGK